MFEVPRTKSPGQGKFPFREQVHYKLCQASKPALHLTPKEQTTVLARTVSSSIFNQQMADAPLRSSFESVQKEPGAGLNSDSMVPVQTKLQISSNPDLY